MGRLKVLIIGVAISLLVSVSVTAGIRLVLGGGGLAEMLTLSAMGQLKEMLWAAHLKPDLYGLDQSDEEALEFLLDSSVYDPGRVELEFFTSDSALEAVQYDLENPNRILIPSQSLYAQDYHPKSFDQLAQTVFMALVNRPSLSDQFAGNGLAKVEWEKLAQKIFSNFDFYSEGVFVGRELSRVWTYEINSKKGELIASRVVLEFKDRSVEVTNLAYEAITCHSPVDLSKVRFYEPVNLGSHLKIKASWSCGDEHFSAALIASLAHELNPITMDIFKFQLTSVAIASVSCEQELSGNIKAQYKVGG